MADRDRDAASFLPQYDLPEILLRTGRNGDQRGTPYAGGILGREIPGHEKGARRRAGRQVR